MVMQLKHYNAEAVVETFNFEKNSDLKFGLEKKLVFSVKLIDESNELSVDDMIHSEDRVLMLE